MAQRLFLIVLFCVFSAALQAETLTGKVVAIADGDTVTLLDRDNRQYKIRLAGIDAPERKQAFYEASRQNLAQLSFGRVAVVEWRKRDRYKRIVGNVIVGGEDVGLLQVRAGYAWWYRDYAREQSIPDRALYESAEIDARALRRGLWQDASPVEPKLQRRAKKNHL